MNNNPFAKTIKAAFEKYVIDKSYYIPHYDNSTMEEPSKAKRINDFICVINNFLQNNGQTPVSAYEYKINENQLIYFAMQISGYFRDAQKELSQLTDKNAVDHDLINLYRASAKYTIDSSEKVVGNRYVFAPNQNYCLWHVDDPQNLDTGSYTRIDNAIAPNPCLLLSMPFQIKPNLAEIQKWTYMNMHDSLKNSDIFGNAVDVFVAHFPIKYPRGEKFATALQTIDNSQEYYTEADILFIQKHLSRFIGKDLVFDRNHRIIGGQAYTPQQFHNNMHNITICTYCAGTHNAHRWVNALEHLSKQIYDEPTVKQALSNVFIISYAGLPMASNNKYSGAHFISNYTDDNMRKEPFVKMFRPELYEKVKYHQNSAPAQISVMPDRRNFVIAHQLASDLAIIDHKSNVKHIPNQENGHNISFITASNIAAKDNFPYYQFLTVLENAALGARGKAVFNSRNYDFYDYAIKSSISFGLRQHLDNSNYR